MEIAKLLEQSYPQLKSTASQMGLDAKGTKSELTERIIRHNLGNPDDKVMDSTLDNKDTSPDQIEKGETKSQILTPGDDDSSIVEKVRIDKLRVDLDGILSGRASYTVDTTRGVILLQGGARQNICLPLSCPDKVILRQAKIYMMPCTVGKDALVSQF